MPYPAGNVSMPPRTAPAMLCLWSPAMAALGRLPSGRRLAAHGAAAALPEWLGPPGPRAVVLCLFDPEVDLEAVLDTLSGCRFAGRVLLLSPPLPDRRLVLREIRAMAPALRLRLVLLNALGR